MNSCAHIHVYLLVYTHYLQQGIIWEEGNDEMNYLYALRQNSTNFNNPENEGRPGVGTTPKTDTLFDRYAKKDEVCVPLDGAAEQGRFELSCTGQYMYNGVLTFQRLVGDFILADTTAAEKGYKVADAGVSYIPFPSPEYEEEGFYEAISGMSLSLYICRTLCVPRSHLCFFLFYSKDSPLC